jgi:hypothetical protein
MTDPSPRYQPEGSDACPPAGAGPHPEVGSGGTGSPPLPPDRYDGPGIFDFLSMGVAAALCLVIGGGVGYLLDAWIGTAPWLTFLGLAFGIVAAVLVTVSQVRKHLS